MDLRRKLIKALGLRDEATDEEIVKVILSKLKARNEANDRLTLRGEIEIWVYDKSGRLKDHRRIKNLIVNAGKAQVAGLINGSVSGAFTYVAIGTGTTAPSASDTALENEVMRVSATVGRTTTSVTNDTATWDATFNITASYAITEAGIFNASSGGTMLARQTFSALNLSSGDTLKISWKIQVS